MQNIHRPLGMESVKICRSKTFWLRIFARRTILRFRSFCIHVKMCVLLRILLKSELKQCVERPGLKRQR